MAEGGDIIAMARQLIDFRHDAPNAQLNASPGRPGLQAAVTSKL